MAIVDLLLTFTVASRAGTPSAIPRRISLEPAGYHFLRQPVEITASAGRTPANSLVITFTIDATLEGPVARLDRRLT